MRGGLILSMLYIAASTAEAAELPLDDVLTDRPSDANAYAEISLRTGVEIWEATGTRNGVSITDYVSLPDPFWLLPGRVDVTYGCPGRTHSYSSRTTLDVPSVGAWFLRCDEEGRLMLLPGSPDD